MAGPKDNNAYDDGDMVSKQSSQEGTRESLSHKAGQPVFSAMTVHHPLETCAGNKDS